MSIDKITEFAGTAPASDKNTNDLDQSRGFPSRLQPARQWFNYLFNTITQKINEIIDKKLDVDANAVSASKLKTARTVSFTGDATGAFNFDGSKNENATFTLANSGVDANTYGGAFEIPVVTVNAKGLITGVSTQDIQNASGSQKGVVQIGSNLSINNGVLSGPSPYSLPTASANTLGGVRIGNNISVNSGSISVPEASGTTKGVVKVGTGLSVAADGTLSSLALGAGQTRQNLTTSRAIATTYTNSTGRVIEIFIDVKFSTPASFVSLIIGNNYIKMRDGEDEYMQIAFSVLPGETYQLSGGEIVSWLEIR
jgi:hypothetical protein